MTMVSHMLWRVFDARGNSLEEGSEKNVSVQLFLYVSKSAVTYLLFVCVCVCVCVC